MRKSAAIVFGAFLAVSATAGPAQGGVNHGYCYANLYSAGKFQKLWVSNPYAPPAGRPDTARDDFAAFVAKLGVKREQAHCDSGYNGPAVAEQAKQKRVDEAKAAGAEVVHVDWPG